MVLTNLLALCLLPLFGSGLHQSSGKPHCSATFELEVVQSQVMKSGKNELKCVNALATAMHRQGPVKYTGIDIFFGPDSHDRSSHLTIRNIQKSSYANLNLMTDTKGNVTQVNMTVVLPGKTVARTIAWSQADLQKYFADVTLSDKRVVLKSAGSFDDPPSATERTRLGWNVDIEVPLLDEAHE